VRERTYLLDTHAWVFYLASPETLPLGLWQVLEEARGREALLVSAITPWEVAVLARKGRITFSLEARVWLKRALEVPGIRVVPLEAGIALEAAYLSARTLVLRHRVPKPRLWKGFSGAPTAAKAAVGYLDLPHPDPADRFIAATALRTGAVLVTKDERLRAYPGVATIWD